ncbi:xylulokinase [Candidatus Zixiibacteriota bacterium]
MKGLFAGLDVSTQSCKIVVIDLEEERVIHLDSVNYDDDLPHFGTRDGVIQEVGEGISESDPTMWIEAVELILQRLMASEFDQKEILSLSVSGQQHGLVALDGAGNLARNRSKLWNDFSTTEECRLLTERVGGPKRMIEEVGNSQRTGYTAPKILHMLRNEPGVYAESATLFLVHNYINWYLTGAADGGISVMEPGDTSGMALWNPVTRAWSPEVLKAIDPGLREKLPPVEPSDRSIGTISPALADRFGLSPLCRIDAGSGDNMYGAIGTGNFRPGIVTVSLGTSGTAYSFTDEPFVDPTGEIASFCDSTGHWLPLLCVSNMANGYNAVIERYGMNHEDFDDVISMTTAGNEGRLLIPWYEGERTPDLPLASPIMFGFGLDGLNRESFCRAVLEGHVHNLCAGFTRMPVEPTVIHLTGGLANSSSWCQMIADVFETETIPVPGEGAALGAAIHAAWVWQKEEGNGYNLREIANPFVVPDESRRKMPLEKNREPYRIQKRLFRAVGDRMRGLEGENPFTVRNELLAVLDKEY